METIHIDLGARPELRLALAPAPSLRFIEDPGHGWLEVPKALYPDAVESCTGYGYESEDAYYLEEDIEMADFLHRHPEINFQSLPSTYDPGFRRGRPNPRNLTFEAFRARWYGSRAS